MSRHALRAELLEAATIIEAAWIEHVCLMRLETLAMVALYLRPMLKREGWPVGKKLVYRLYRELGLQMRTKKRRKLASAQRATTQAATKRNETMVDGLRG